MLWKKQENGFYVNLCQEDLELRVFERTTLGYGLPPRKLNAQSLQHRKTGNMYFSANQWQNAITSYNTSLCYAENFTESVGLAYGNRSACFLHLQMYEKCLTDIDLAIKAKFPEQYMPKLEKRKADCLKLIEENGQSAIKEIEMSFEAHANYHGMANVLQIQQSVKYGRHVTATEKVGVGKVLFMEKAFLSTHEGKYKRCDACWKTNVNLVPCTKCTSALFCPGRCEQTEYHRIECGMRVVDVENYNDMQMQLVRSLLIAITEFASVESLMEFVEAALTSDPNEIPSTLFDIKSKYRAFLKLTFDRKTMKKETFPTQVCFMYKTLLNHPAIKPKFSTPKHSRFLMHLIGHHLCVVQCNIGALMYSSQQPTNICQAMSENLSILVNYINHSCAPNVGIYSFNEFNVCISLRPIGSGDQLFVSYFRNDSMEHNNTIFRQKYLRDICEFHCDCDRCMAATEMSNKSMADVLNADSGYQYVRKNWNTTNCCDRYGRNERVLLLCSCIKTKAKNSKMLLEKCVEFLDKFGQMKYTPELGFVLRCLESLFRDKYEK